MRICVGLLGGHPGWSLLLEQEGIPYVINPDEFFPAECSVLVIAGSLPEPLRPRVLQYLREGGAVICSSRVFAALGGGEPVHRHVRYLVPGSTPVFATVGLIDTDLECELPPGANAMLTDTGLHAVYAGPFQGGEIVVLPFEAGSLALDRRIGRVSFYAQRRRLPFERVSVVSKGALRRLIARSLELLHHARGIPYVHRWYYPDEHNNVFALRIDTDGASRNEIRALGDFLADRFRDTHPDRYPVSWFVDVRSQEEWLGDYRGIGGEVGIHCYDHIDFVSAEQCREDISRAGALFNRHGFQAQGYAAPFGRWNEELGNVIDSAGFEYSSEFAYDYDNLPSFPTASGTTLRILQIPVHPISIGMLRRQGFSEAEMKEYFRSVIGVSTSLREPLVFYHHPRDGHPAVLDDMIRMSRAGDPAMMQMRDYAGWWRHRGAAGGTIAIDRGRMMISRDNGASDVRLRVTLSDGTEAFVPAGSTVELRALPWIAKPQAPPIPADIARTRDFNPWIPLIMVEDRIARYFR